MFLENEVLPKLLKLLGKLKTIKVLITVEQCKDDQIKSARDHGVEIISFDDLWKKGQAMTPLEKVPVHKVYAETTFILM